MALGLQVHRAPRTLRVLGTQADIIRATGRSIIAGCTLSTSLARAYLRPALQHVDLTAEHTIAEHVDDMDQLVLETNSDKAIRTAVVQGQLLAQGLRE